MRYGMVVDLSRCVGCNTCTLACRQKNGTPPGTLWRSVHLGEIGEYPNAKLQFQHMQCMHCKDAPCVEACPTGATVKHENGIVTVDPELCIGCRYCMVACPYNARFFNYGEAKEYYEGLGYTQWEENRPREHFAGTVGKCDLCIDRLQEGRDPACVQACPASALHVGDLEDTESEVSQLIASNGAYQLHPELGTDPSVYYLPA
jgi:Fe-S-cluster-containing dehydrogenase component